jgi:hypothetical protein
MDMDAQSSTVNHRSASRWALRKRVRLDPGRSQLLILSNLAWQRCQAKEAEKSAEGIVGRRAEGLNLNLQGGLIRLDGHQTLRKVGKKKPLPTPMGEGRQPRYWLRVKSSESRR